MRRLEELLKDAGPNITVRPAGSDEPMIPAGPGELNRFENQDADLPPTGEPSVRNAKIVKPGSGTDARRTAPAGSRPPRRAATADAPIGAAKAPITTQAHEPARRISPKLKSPHGELWDAITASRRPFMATALFSLIINLLMLTGPLFMLQVYDRVMTSGSMPTLVALAALTTTLYGIVGILELVRSRVIVRIGTEIDGRMADRIFRASLSRSILSPAPNAAPLRELDSLRQFLGGLGPITLFDAPWTPIYLLVIFMVHWVLGVSAIVGGSILIALAWISETRSRAPLQEAGKAAATSLDFAETGQRNAEALLSMGMASAYRTRWHDANGQSLAWQIKTSDTLGGLSAASKSLKLLLQSLMLAIGAALAVGGEISPGSIIAATIIFGRALAPVEQAIGQWRNFLKARESYDKLSELLAAEPEPPQKTALPAPQGHLHVEQLRVASPDSRHLILAGVTFAVAPGQMLAVIGPSASGKSTLVRTLVNLWPALSGTIKLDGARLDQWDPEALGKHIGYLPQNVGLFAGTVRENIARFQADANDDEIVEAAQQAHAHDLILQLPHGYDTQLGAFGAYLSAGQRQRIALARALFRDPALVVLDEPNSNLDRAGDEALSSAIDGMRSRGQAVVLVSHRVQAIGKADLLLYLERGTQRAFGPRQEVLKMFQAPAPDAQPRGAPA